MRLSLKVISRDNSIISRDTTTILTSELLIGQVTVLQLITGSFPTSEASLESRKVEKHLLVD